MKFLLIFIILFISCEDNSGENFFYNARPPVGNGSGYNHPRDEQDFYDYNDSDEDVIVEDNGSVENDVVFSNIISARYLLKVYLPESYDTNSNYPVVYVLDAEWAFSVIQKYIVQYGYKALVVGVSNNGTRDYDYMPANDCADNGGGYENYHKFLTNELVPYIDLKYKTDKSNRALAGHSFSGAMSLIALFHENEENPVFNKFIASDPSILCHPSFFYKLISLKASSERKIKLHISKSNQNTDDVTEFFYFLQGRHSSWLEIYWHEYTDKDHYQVMNPSFKNGLKFLFEER